MGAVGFLSPWLLLGLVVLPVLWWLLRAVPPAPVRRRFPAVTLLLGLTDQRVEAMKTPWWLILLRLLAAAALIVGFAGPLLNPNVERRQDVPLAVLIDSFWPAASDWSLRVAAVDDLLVRAQQSGRKVLVVLAHDPSPVALAAAGDWRERLAAMAPVAWDAPYDLSAIDDLPAGQTVWVSDGLAREGRQQALALREAAGPVEIWQPNRTVLGLTPATLVEGDIELRALRSSAGPGQRVQLRAFGPDPEGQLRVLFTEDIAFVAGAKEAAVLLSPPPELRHRVHWFDLSQPAPTGGVRPVSSGQVALVGEGLTRRRVALIGAQDSETLALLSPDHFLRAALEPTAEIVEATRLQDALRASPHVVILPDVPELAEPDQRALAKWVAGGGLLLRFAGPRLAAAQIERGAGAAAANPEDVLLPVRLRGRGRTVGGAMSWGAPQRLAPFPADGPFAGLRIPEDVTVARQVLAEPGPDLAGRTLARLADGTPLVTRKTLGAGQVILMHVGANAEWSNLVLSGLFVEMLKRLTAAGAAVPADDMTEGGEGAATLEQAGWQRVHRLTAAGRVVAEEQPVPVAAQDLFVALDGQPGAEAAPGLYTSLQDAASARQLTVNTLSADAQLSAADWPARIVPRWGAEAQARDLTGAFLGAALMLVLADILATLVISGRLSARLSARDARRTGVVLLALMLVAPDMSRAEGATDDGLDQVIAAASEVTLAHVLTGDADLDALARAGLTGLSEALYSRSSVEPAAPVGLDLERDELSVYPLLYWPVTPDQPLPSAAAYGRLSRYLAAGGLILFDTRDAGTGRDGQEAQKLQALAAPLTLPPLDPIPSDHVLTRAFYLIDSFPGRYSGPVWAEAAPPGAQRAEGLPFRLLNDGVTPVIIGGNDWAGAWAVDAMGRPTLPVGRGLAGERQREMAFRFGVNLVMHVLTGNYKSDQVHVPALLQRLGQ